MNNKDTLTESVKWMYFGFTVELGLNMGWIKYRAADGNEADHVVQGLNLLLKDKKGPKEIFKKRSHRDGKIQTMVSGSCYYPTCTIGVSFGLTRAMRDSMRLHSLASSNVSCTCT